MASLPTHLHTYSIARLAELIKTRQLSPVELTQCYLDRIAAHNGYLNCYLTVFREEALRGAQEAEREIVAGRYRGPLHGIPLAMKDNIAMQGSPNAAGCLALSHVVATEDAPVVTRLREAGAVLLGRTNMHELAYGVTTLNPHYGATRNPWQPTAVPGGSSGGSAAAVAAGLAAGALGTDTGGSIRIPAALCGVVGLKPSYGRVSRSGVIPLSWSLDHVGPIVRTVEDAALLLNVLADSDTPLGGSNASEALPREDFAAPLAAREALPREDFTASLAARGDLAGLRVAVPRNHFFDTVDPQVERAVRDAIEQLVALGARTEEVTFAHAELIMPVSRAIVLAEASSYHEQLLRERPGEFSEQARAALELGALLPAVRYLEAQKARRVMAEAFLVALEPFDVFVAPTTSVTAPPIGATSVAAGAVTLSVRDALLRFTYPFNFSGLPAISLPCGFSNTGLPIGLQLVGKPWAERTILRVAQAYEQATPWHTRMPEDAK